MTTTRRPWRLLDGVEIEHAEHGWSSWQSWPPSPDGRMVVHWRRISYWADQRTQASFEQIHHRRLLTPREAEVLELVAEGFTAEQIAAKWGLSVKTVHTHTQNLKHRLHATSLAHAVALAMRHGLIPLDPTMLTIVRPKATA